MCIGKLNRKWNFQLSRPNF